MSAAKQIRFDLWPVHPAAQEGALIVPYLDISGEDAPTAFLFTLEAADGGKYGLIAAANLHTLQGDKKAGKSAAGLALITAALKGGFIGITPSRPDLSVLWIDTEQDRDTLRRKARAVLTMAGLDTMPDRVKVVTLRGFGSTEELLKATLQAITETAPDFVFLDGVVDLCEAFNDEEKSRAVIRQLEAYAERYGCAILGLIHTNKTSRNEARGHLGAILQQKSAEIYQVTKDGERTAKVTQPFSRFAPVPDFFFNFADGFTIEAAQVEAEGNGATQRCALDRAFSPLYCDAAGHFDPKTRFAYKELVQAYRDYHQRGERTAKDAISRATALGVLERKQEGKRIYYTLTIGGLFDPEEDAL